MANVRSCEFRRRAENFIFSNEVCVCTSVSVVLKPPKFHRLICSKELEWRLSNSKNIPLEFKRGLHVALCINCLEVRNLRSSLSVACEGKIAELINDIKDYCNPRRNDAGSVCANFVTIYGLPDICFCAQGGALLNERFEVDLMHRIERRLG